MWALAFPAYIITASWDVLDCNAPVRRTWGIGDDELPFNAVERLFLDARARELHGGHLVANIAPIVAMLRSAEDRRPHVATLQRLWDAYEIVDPLVPRTCTIESPIRTFRFEAPTLANPGETSGIVQIPDRESRDRLASR